MQQLMPSLELCKRGKPRGFPVAEITQLGVGELRSTPGLTLNFAFKVLLLLPVDISSVLRMKGLLVCERITKIPPEVLLVCPTPCLGCLWPSFQSGLPSSSLQPELDLRWPSLAASDSTVGWVSPMCEQTSLRHAKAGLARSENPLYADGAPSAKILQMASCPF